MDLIPKYYNYGGPSIGIQGSCRSRLGSSQGVISPSTVSSVDSFTRICFIIVLFRKIHSAQILVITVIAKVTCLHTSDSMPPVLNKTKTLHYITSFTSKSPHIVDAIDYSFISQQSQSIISFLYSLFEGFKGFILVTYLEI